MYRKYAKYWLTTLLLVACAVGTTTAGALEFAYKRVHGIESLVLSGEIKSGDAKRLREFLARNAENYLRHDSIDLDSPGGDVGEAIKLAQVLREVVAYVTVYPEDHCASACFFLVVGAPIHMIATAPDAGVGIHRPFFAKGVTQQMSIADADQAHGKAYAQARQWLQDQFVSQVLIDKLFSLPSTQGYWLTLEDTDALGNRAPWYEEWVLARCPRYVTAEQRVFATREGTQEREEALLALKSEQRCEAQATVPEQIKTLNRYRAELHLNPLHE